MKKPNTQSLTRLADAAFRQAAQKVIQRAINSRTPVIVWEDGQVKKVDPRKRRLPRTNRNNGRAEA